MSGEWADVPSLDWVLRLSHAVSWVKPYLAVHPINYPIVLGNPDLVKPYQVSSLPVTLLIDREGKIADAHVGMVVKDVWEREIRQLLRER